MAGHAERTLRPEDEVAHYRIVSPLGAGGMGEVYLAQDKTLERNVALKILPPELVKNEDRVRRFGLEAKSASSLSHPNIVTIYEIGHDLVRSAGAADSGPVHYISMELVSGKTLSTLIHDDKLDLRTLLGYLAQAAEGLAKAHAAGIVHRDLKPGNIMVSSDGFTKVLDFGLAKLTEKREGGQEISEAPTLAAGSEVGSVVGTAGYMSPEQVQGRTVDHRSDVFSFGCILYEAATRRKPFAAETGIETMHKILNEKPVPVEELNAGVPAELRRLIRRCLAKNPDQRAQSIKDLAIELREIVEEYDSLSVSGSSATQASSQVAVAAARPAGRLARPLVAGAVLLAVAGLAAGWWGLRRAGRQGGRPSAFQSMRMSTQTNRGDVIDGVISPDGRYLAYLAGQAGRASLRVRQVATGSDVEVLPARDATLGNPAFSPDGNYLFYLTRTPDNPIYSALFQVPSLGGTPQQRAFDVDSRVSFSPDGRKAAFWRRVSSKQQSLLVIVDLGSSREQVLVTIGNTEVFQGSPAWSADGGTIAALLLRLADLQTAVAFFDALSGARQDFVTLPRILLQSLSWLPDGGGLVASGQDLRSALNNQVFLISRPGGRLQRVTNDFYRYSSVSVSSGEEAIAALRLTRLANIWAAEAAGGPARQITSISNPEDSPFGLSVVGADTVVFDAPRDQAVQIWTVGFSGGEPRTTTSDRAASFNVVGRGDQVFFDRLDDSGLHVWKAGKDGGEPRQLTSGPGEQKAAVSQDGRLLAFQRFEALGSLSLLKTDTGEVKPLASGVTGWAGFSRDATRFLYSQAEPDAQGLSRSVWKVISLAGGTVTASFKLPAQTTEAAWSPDGRGMTFCNQADPAWNVYRQDADGKEPVPVTRFSDGRVTSYAWSLDGTRLAVTRRVGDGSNVWVTGPDGSHPMQVTQLAGSDVFAVRWLPDNRRLVVSAGKLSRDMVLIRSFR